MKSLAHLVVGVQAAVLAVASVASGQAPEVRTVKLQFRAGAGVYTPAKLVGEGKSFRFGTDGGEIDVLGRKLLLGARYVLDGYLLGLDCNGDGKVGGSEWVRVDLQTHAARFGLLLPDGEKKREHALRFTNVDIRVQANRVTHVSGRVMSDGCMAGRLDDVEVVLVDDNMDGHFTQDGKDAVAFGGGAGAMPLYQHHQVGKAHCLVDVAADGSQVTLQPTEETELGLVDVPVRAALLRCLVLADEGGSRAYDIKASGAMGIPAGTYKLSYAVLAAGGRVVVAGETKKSLSYPIAARKVNILRFGPPFTLTFGASVDYRSNQVRVSNDIAPHGAGGEEYSLRFAGYHPFGENPNVVLTNGRMTLSNTYMTYDAEDRLMPFAEYIPQGFTKSTGKVVLTCDLPVLGKAVGVRDLEGIIDRKKPEPPDPKVPAVATRDLPEGIALGPRPVPKPAPKPAPPPPPPPPTPRPRPEMRPSKPRAPDPEYDAAVLLTMANAFLQQGKRELGVEKLKEVVKAYPGTHAAKEADGKLIDIQLEDESN